MLSWRPSPGRRVNPGAGPRYVGVARMKRLLLLCLVLSAAPAFGMDSVRASDDGKGFTLEPSKRPFRVLGFNYDHDRDGRLIEDYWDAEWPTVEADFREMKDLGANVVRVHLQFGRFMESVDRPNAEALDRLGKLLALCEELNIYLDITGLGCYHKKDVPAWYDTLDEKGRWRAQAAFWEAVAARCAKSPAVFCYDLMNEPVVPGGRRKAGDWLGPPFGESTFVQFVTLDQADRPRPEIARDWLATLRAAVRKHDGKHLVTVGLVDWSLDRPGLTSGFVPKAIVGELDFVCVHRYPDRNKSAEAMETLKGFDVGKPVVIEETFPLKCPIEELARFLDEARPRTAGTISFYWGKTPEEMKASKSIVDAIMNAWLGVYSAQSKERDRK